MAEEKEPFAIQVLDRGQFVVLALAGAFMSTGFGRLRSTLEQIISRDSDSKRFLVLDLTETTLLTSSCLESMYAARRETETKDFEVVVVAPSDDIRELFELTGFDRFFAMYESVDAFVAEKGLS